MAAKSRNVRIPDDSWEPAMDRARAEGTTLSALISSWVRAYAGLPSPVALPAVPAKQAGRVQCPHRNWGRYCPSCGRAVGKDGYS